RAPIRIQAEMAALGALGDAELQAALQAQALRRYAVALGPRHRAALLDEERAAGSRVCTDLAIDLLGDALGASIGRALEADGGEDAASLVASSILAALPDEVNRLPWLDDESRADATKSVSRLRVRVGPLPDRGPPSVTPAAVQGGTLLTMMRSAFAAREKSLVAAA